MKKELLNNSKKTTRQVDVAIIGAGSAGLPAFRAARKHTENIVLIEGGTYGTTCARVGCMPSKLLIAAAEAAHSVESAAGFGVHTTNHTINGLEVMERVRNERDRFVGFVLDGVESIDEKHHIRNPATFLDNNTLQVGDSIIEAKTVVIATGSSPALLPEFEELGKCLIVNDDIFNWQTLPDSVAVFGPGVIGLELGQALHRLGVRIRLFGRSGSLKPLTDIGIRDYALDIFQKEFPLDAKANVLGMELKGDQAMIRFVDREDGLEKIEKFNYVL
ncbi:MAG TPA: dihydrolipoyl dehydrogenase, partial [Deltaproteobacteria bacterium]|nr:dihydrolipoyl dehydrogenase [Deltaproteobacteria bacterium]